MREGLVVRLVDEAALPDLVTRVLPLAALYAKPEPEIQAMVREWVMGRWTWCLGVYWRGEVLQYETYHFQRPGPPAPPAHGRFDESVAASATPREIMGGFNAHLDRERPHWFYREVGRPMLEALIRVGVRSVHSYIRADRPDFVQYLADTHGHVVHGLTPNGQTIHVSCDIARARAACTGWPAVQSLGADWAWTQERVSVREATPEDLAWLASDWMAATWGQSKRRPAIASLLERWVGLDQATVLLGFVGGDLKEVRLFRPRRGAIASLGVLNPVPSPGTTSPERIAIMRGMLTWCRSVGYTTLSTWVPVWQMKSSDTFQRRLRTMGWRHVRDVNVTGLPSHELALDVMESLA